VNFSRSIRRQLFLHALLLALFSALFTYATLSFWHLRQSYLNGIHTAHAIAKMVAQKATRIILLKEITTAADINRELASFPHLLALVIYTPNGEAIYEYSADGQSFPPPPFSSHHTPHVVREGPNLTLFQDITYPDRLTGYLWIKLRIKTFAEILKENFPFLVSALAIIALLVLFFAQKLAEHFSRPILKLVAYLSKIGDSPPAGAHLSCKRQDEIGKLYSAVNAMLTRIQKNQETLKIAAVAFETQNATAILDRHLHLLKVNDAFVETTGYTQQEAQAHLTDILNPYIHDCGFFLKILRKVRQTGYWKGELSFRHKEGSIHPEKVSIQTVNDPQGHTRYFVISFIDLSKQKAMEKRLAFMERHDPLTGLLNRQGISEAIQWRMRQNHTRYSGVLARINIKNFRLINEAYGRKTADKLLILVAERLKKACPNSLAIARLFADEFMLIPHLFAQEDDLIIKAETALQKLLDILEEEYEIDNQKIALGFNIGVVLIDRDEENVENLFRYADFAVETAKYEGKKIAFFDRKAQERANEYAVLYTRLLVALRKGEFRLYFQPQLNADRRLCGAEALIRWQHPEKGLLTPGEFIPLAERSDLIIQIGHWVLDAACAQLARWEKELGEEEFCVAVNISARQFHDENFETELYRIVERHGISLHRLKLELTETLLIANREQTIEKMRRIRQSGIRIALDDFGTEYASLAYLKSLPIDQLKIDMGFVRTMLKEPVDEAIVKSILLLGQSLNLEVIAEGVESEAHYKRLKEMGCRCFQGYYFSKPLPPEAITLA